MVDEAGMVDKLSDTRGAILAWKKRVSVDFGRDDRQLPSVVRGNV